MIIEKFLVLSIILVRFLVKGETLLKNETKILINHEYLDKLIENKMLSFLIDMNYSMWSFEPKKRLSLSPKLKLEESE